ncbi:synaptonemal complex central element protein 1-like isoform X2 [Gigantopelta aegis]|uniref:synaptonemal complex central element protein 1-like isoform X2 n=1 Tax=Gigantopelta aegis TaxID=1735272 RepID=UPI001B88D1CA|nr:synaptonemal complex central element protein 1-like isoform X2 [Gigantopelta aegis]
MEIPNFKIDSLLHSVKELQNANVKLVQVNDIHIKMSETLKVAEMKASKTQSQALCLEEANQVKREKILDLNTKIEFEKVEQQEDTDHFEEELVGLASQMKTSRLFYENENVEKEIVSSENEITDLEGKSCENHQLIEQLTKDLCRIKSHISIDDDGISDETRRLVWLMVKKENHSLHKFLNRLQDELDSINENLEDSMM